MVCKWILKRYFSPPIWELTFYNSGLEWEIQYFSCLAKIH